MNVTFLEKQITFHKCGCLKEYSKFFPLRELGFAVIDSDGERRIKLAEWLGNLSIIPDNRNCINTVNRPVYSQCAVI